MSRNAQGTLVTADSGNAVLDVEGAPINVPSDNFRIGESGEVFVTEDGEEVSYGTIGLFTAPLERLRKVGANLFDAGVQQIEAAQNAKIVHGHLEVSGVEPTRELVSLIDASRTFEANVNMLRMQDESLGRLLQSFTA